MYVVIILLTIALIACGFTAWFYAKQVKCNRIDIVKLQNINEELEEFKTITSTKLEVIDNLIQDKNAELAAANRLIEQTTNLVAAKDEVIVSMQTKIDDLNAKLNSNHLLQIDAESAQKMKQLIAELDESYRQKNQNYVELEENYVARVNALNEVNGLIEQAQSMLLAGQCEAARQGEELERLKAELLSVAKELDEMRQFHHDVLVREHASDVKGWRLTCDAKESRLVGLIDELVGLCPELEKDLKSIGWKRVWLPKLQDLCNREGLDRVCGIYRIRLVEDEEVCYVGQAVNVKERWYTHVKKMVGAEVKGSEKLYEYKPDELVWEVVEEVSRDKLDERERYWIDWWGCKEIGLNKKK